MPVYLPVVEARFIAHFARAREAYFLGVNPERITLLQSGGIGVRARTNRGILSIPHYPKPLFLERQSGIVGSANHPYADDFYPRKYTIDVVRAFFPEHARPGDYVAKYIKEEGRTVRLTFETGRVEKRRRGGDRVESSRLFESPISRCNWTLTGGDSRCNAFRFVSFRFDRLTLSIDREKSQRNARPLGNIWITLV